MCENKKEKINWHQASLQSSRGMYQGMFLNFNQELHSNERTLDDALKSLGKIKSKYSRDVEVLSNLGHRLPLLQTQLDAYEILN